MTSHEDWRRVVQLANAVLDAAATLGPETDWNDPFVWLSLERIDELRPYDAEISDDATVVIDFWPLSGAAVMLVRILADSLAHVDRCNLAEVISNTRVALDRFERQMRRR